MAAASIVVGEVDELREVLQEFEAMTLDTDGIELVSVSKRIRISLGEPRILIGNSI